MRVVTINPSTCSSEGIIARPPRIGVGNVERAVILFFGSLGGGIDSPFDFIDQFDENGAADAAPRLQACQ